MYQIIQEESENAHYGVQSIYLLLKNYHGYTRNIRTFYCICKENYLLIHKKQRLKSIIKANKAAEKPKKTWLHKTFRQIN